MKVLDKIACERYVNRLVEGGVEARSVVIRQDGREVFSRSWSPFETSHVHPLYSATKSFTSVGIGLLVGDGLVDVSQPWISWFPEYDGAVAGEWLREATVRDLLTMTFGQDSVPVVHGDDDWACNVLGKEASSRPGTTFYYNSMCSHLLSLLVEKISGQSLADLLGERLFEPLGIKDWWWERDRHGHSTGGFGLHLSTPDLASFGQCLLDQGAYGGRQVIPAEWVREATRRQVETSDAYPVAMTEDRNGYGYQFWMCAEGGFRSAGLFGQVCYVRPEDRIVLATSCSTSGSKAVLDPFYKTLREVAAGSAGLRETTGEEGIPTLDGLAVGGVASPRLWGVHEALENYAGVSALGFSFANGILALEIVCGRQAFSVRASFGRWLAQKDGVGGFSSFLTHDAELDDPPAWDTTTLYACYAWEGPSTLRVRARSLDSTRRYEMAISLDGAYATLSYEVGGLVGTNETALVSVPLAQ